MNNTKSPHRSGAIAPDDAARAPSAALAAAEARNARGGPDYTDRAGAEKLKARIEAYWRERGSEVQIMLVPAGFTAALRAARYDVRSELLNGLPQRGRRVCFG